MKAPSNPPQPAALPRRPRGSGPLHPGARRGQRRRAFSIELFDGETIANEGGEAATQAGSHPYATTTEMRVQHRNPGQFGLFPVSGRPRQGPGGRPARRPDRQSQRGAEVLVGRVRTAGGLRNPRLPEQHAVGVARVEFFGGVETYFFPVYNMVAGPGRTGPVRDQDRRRGELPEDRGAKRRRLRDDGEPARHLRGASPDRHGAHPLGLPGDPSHDACGAAARAFVEGNCPFYIRGTAGQPAPCSPCPRPARGRCSTTLRANSWLEQGNYEEASFLSHDAADEPVGIEGCEKLPFDPSLQMQVDPGRADSPAALERQPAHPAERSAPKASPARS